MITTALFGRAVRRSQECIDFWFVEVAQARSVIAFERHGADLAAPGNQLRAALPDEGREAWMAASR